MKTISVINQKGGVGKTTTAHALGTGLLHRGYKVLFVDLDAQCNLSFSVGADVTGITIIHLLQHMIDPAQPEYSVETVIQHTPQGGIIPGSQVLAGADAVMVDVIGKEYKIKEILESVSEEYDYCIIDTPPTLGTLTINALTASDQIVAPAQADVYSLAAIGQLYGTIQTVKKYCNPNLEFSGILLTRYSPRAVISRDVTDKLAELAERFSTKLYETKIRECTAIKEAQITQQDLFIYAPKSNAVADYNAFLDELLEVR